MVTPEPTKENEGPNKGKGKGKGRSGTSGSGTSEPWYPCRKCKAEGDGDLYHWPQSAATVVPPATSLS